jgi:hypothetical protein
MRKHGTYLDVSIRGVFETLYRHGEGAKVLSWSEQGSGQRSQRVAI